MKVWQQIKDFKKEFFTINQTELTPFSKLLMTIFFFTALWLIAAGIDSTVHQATPPEKRYGYQCRYLANDTHPTLLDFQKRKRLEPDAFGIAPECRKLKTAYLQITDDMHIQSQISQIRQLEQKRSRIRYEIDTLNKNYANMLLEKIADQPKERSILKTRADKAKEKLTALRAQEQHITEQIKQKENLRNYPKTQRFLTLLDQTKEQINEGYTKARRYYRLKMSAQIFAFVIPIWLLFYMLYRTLQKGQKFIFAKLSFYVASAAALYGLVELVQLIYSIIPKLFLTKLIAFFTSHNMIIVLNVLGILLFLGIFGLIIHKVQKNHEKNRATKDTRILNVKRNLCYNCAAPRHESDRHCGFCGVDLKQKCSACHAEIYKYTLFCTKCGKEVESQ